MVRSSNLSLDPAGEFPMGPEEYAFYLVFQIQRRRDLMLDETLKGAGLNTARWRTLGSVAEPMGALTKDIVPANFADAQYDKAVADLERTLLEQRSLVTPD